MAFSWHFMFSLDSSIILRAVWPWLKKLLTLQDKIKLIKNLIPKSFYLFCKNMALKWLKKNLPIKAISFTLLHMLFSKLYFFCDQTQLQACFALWFLQCLCMTLCHILVALEFLAFFGKVKRTPVRDLWLTFENFLLVDSD